MGENDENNHVYVGHNIPETGVKTVTFEYKAGNGMLTKTYSDV